MALKSGLASQIGIKKETTAGVALAPTRFQPFLSESMTNDRSRLDGDGVIAGRRTRDSTQWNGGTDTVGGDTGFELYDRGLGSYWEACLGGYDGGSGSGPYAHVFTPGDLAAWTVQLGRPSVLGVVHPFTYSGSKVASWELACQTNAVATFGITWASMYEQAGSRVVTDAATTSGDATITSASAAFTQADLYKSVSGTGIPAGAKIASVTNATTVELSANATATATGVTVTFGLALATASYPADRHLLKFNHGSVKIGGTEVKVKAATVNGDNGLATDRYFLGQTHADEAIEQELRTYAGSLDVEFTDLTQYGRYLSGEEMALELSYSAGDYGLVIAENIRYETGTTPQVDPKTITPQSLPFMAIGDGTDASAITVTMTSPDATI